MTGIYPVDRSKLMPVEYNDENYIEEDHGLPYLPMLTPSSRRTSRKIKTEEFEPDSNQNSTYSAPEKPLGSFLKYPEPVHKLPNLPEPKHSSRVTTGPEYIEEMEKKALEKARAAYLKEERKHIREVKKGKAINSTLKVYVCISILLVFC